jgi:hypothetical protein
MLTRSEFVAAYAAQLAKTMAERPQDYAANLDPETVAGKMTDAIEADEFNHDAPALKALLAQHGVTGKKYTRKNVLAWYKANVTQPAAPLKSLGGAGVPVNSETDLTQYIGHSIYARTAMNAYIGRMVLEKEGYVQIEGAFDTDGTKDITLRVPRRNIVAVIEGEPHPPTPDDFASFPPESL